MKFTVELKQTVIQRGFMTIEANSEEEAERLALRSMNDTSAMIECPEWTGFTNDERVSPAEVVRVMIDEPEPEDAA